MRRIWIRPAGEGNGSAFGHTFGVRVDEPLARGFLRFLSLTAFQAEGCGIALSGDEYKVSVTSLPYCIIWRNKHSAGWLAALASPYPASPDFPPKGETTHYDLCVAGAPSNHIRCASTGKRVTRFSGRFASLRIVFPCHPCSGGRINRSMLFCRDMAPWLNIHSPTTEWGEGGGASHQRGNAFPRPPGRLYGFRRQRGYKKWRRRRRTSPAQRYYITPEGESPEPACKAKPITGRTLTAQGRKARRLAQPSRS